MGKQRTPKKIQEDPVFTSHREDGRFVDTRAFVYYALRTLKPKLAFDPSLTRDAYLAWKAKVRRKLRQLLAFPKPPPQPEPKLIWTKQRDGYSLQRWESYPEEGWVIPFLLLLPDGVSATNPAPGVMCIPGTISGKEQTANEPLLDPSHFIHKEPYKVDRNRFAYHYAKAGFVAVAVDHVWMTEQQMPSPREGPERVRSVLSWMGRSIPSMGLFQEFTILQWLKRRPFVRGKDVACAGHSLGGWESVWLALLDPDVKAVVYNACAYDVRKCTVTQRLDLACRRIPGAIEWFDHLDLIAALAPCPLLVSEGGRTEYLERIGRAYEIMGVPENFKYVHYPRYAKASARTHDRKPIPDYVEDHNGVYCKYINCDWRTHSFRYKTCVPWLREVLMDRR